MARGTAFEVINTCDGSRRSACNLGLARENVKIRCLTDYMFGDTRKILLGLEVVAWRRNGVLCVYDLTLSKVTRAIWIPEPVTYIGLIDIEAENETVLTKLR